MSCDVLGIKARTLSVFKALQEQIYGKIHAKSPSTLGPALFPGTVCSLVQESTCIFFMVKGLVYSLQLNSKVKYH